MTEDFNPGRRNFLKTAVTAGAAALAGCPGGTDQGTAGTSTEEHTTESAETHTTESGKTDTAVEEADEELSDEEMKSLLEEKAYELHDDLYMNGYEGSSFKMVDADEAPVDDAEYRLSVGVDIESLFHKSGEKGRKPDLHTATELGLEGEVMEDVSSQLYELTGFINDRLDSFYEEAGSPEEVPINVDINISGSRGSDYILDLNTSEGNLDPTLTRFINDPSTTGIHGFKPMEYENLKLMEEGEVMTLDLVSEHTIEYLDDGVFKINGQELEERDDREKLGRFDGEDVYVNDVDPIYLQEERDDIEGAVELSFESLEPEY